MLLSATDDAFKFMGKIYESIDEKLRAWLSAQKVFFVATAPLSRDGHMNCSPKDGESFRVLDERTVVYLDLTGSGVETMARGRRSQLEDWAEQKGEEFLVKYRQAHNSRSIDRLEGIASACGETYRRVGEKKQR